MIKSVFKQMLITQILSSMTVMLCMLIDSIIIGRCLGVDAMTAYGLASPVLLIFAAFGNMLSAGVQVMCGKTTGNGDREGTDKCYTITVILTAGISALGLFLVLVFTNPLCTLLGAGQNVPGNVVFVLTRDYLRGFIIGAPAFIFCQVMIPFMQLSGNRVRLIAAVLTMTVANITGNLLNVYVFHGKTFGMGLASTISYYIAFFIGVVYFFRKDCIFHFNFKGLKAKLYGELLKYGVPTVINQVSFVFLVYVVNKVLLDVGGPHAVASYSVISTIGNICYSFGTGIGSVTLMLSAMFYAEEDRTSLISLVKTMAFYAVVLDAALIGVVLLAAPALITLFIPDIAENFSVREMAIKGLRLFSLSLLPCSLNTALKNYYQGTNKTPFTEAISVMQNFAFTAIFAFAFSRFLLTDGVWIAFLCGEVLTLAVITAVVWYRRGGMSFSAESYSLIGRDFGAAPEDLLEITINSADGVRKAGRAAEDFCVAHGETTKQSMFIALCIEEMSNNIVAHGFTYDDKPHSIEIRLLFRGDTKVVRIRDNCVHFDPVNYFELHKLDDPEAHIGVRMVMRSVKDANYVNSFGLNNLTLIM